MIELTFSSNKELGNIHMQITKVGLKDKLSKEGLNHLLLFVLPIILP